MQIVSNECGSDTSLITIEVIKQVGYEDITSSGFSIYPNPSTQHVVIRPVNGSANSYSLQIFNTAGQLIYAHNTFVTDAHILDVRNWAPGVYEFVFNDSKQIKHLRFIR
jgi:hypothetical protein